MSMGLVKYDAARTALAAAHRIDEVKSIHDKAAALTAYARQAKDTQMMVWVTEIKVRAERRMGELLREMPKNTGAKGSQVTGTKKVPLKDSAPTLHDLNITKKESARCQKVAKMPEPEFDQRIKDLKEKQETITAKKVLAIAATPQPWDKARAVQRLAQVLNRELAGWPHDDDQRILFANELCAFGQQVITSIYVPNP